MSPRVMAKLAAGLFLATIVSGVVAQAVMADSLMVRGVDERQWRAMADTAALSAWP
jgi:hypothetical protein